MASLQASHGRMSSIMETVERVYSLVHTDDPSLFPLAQALEKTDATKEYFSKIARFRTVNDLQREECFYHVNARGVVTEIKEELGLSDGYAPVPGFVMKPESDSDFSWFYGTLGSADSPQQSRLFVSLSSKEDLF